MGKIKLNDTHQVCLRLSRRFKDNPEITERIFECIKGYAGLRHSPQELVRGVFNALLDVEDGSSFFWQAIEALVGDNKKYIMECKEELNILKVLTMQAYYSTQRILPQEELTEKDMTDRIKRGAKMGSRVLSEEFVRMSRIKKDITTLN